MYRRNITHLLVPLGMALVLIVVYQLFVKALIAPLPDTIPSNGQTVEVVSGPPAPANAMHVTEGPQQVRALDQAVVPAVQDMSVLETIRDDLEKGNLSAAETQLTALPPQVLSDARAKAFVAVLWNNLGLERERLEGTAVALKAFKKAAALDEHNPVIHLNLAHAYWEQRDRAFNLDFLARLVSLAPNEPFPHLAMADLLYEQDKLSESITHLTHATERMKSDPALRSYLEVVTAKIHRADTAEARMTARNSTHFMVKFDGREDQETWTTVLAILEEAYREIGQRFGHFPSKPVVVVLHTQGTFQSATGSPTWADGLFDSVLGRIQIPTRGATTEVPGLTHVLRHEYVHALLHDRMGSSAGFVPTWLNEGLAMQMDGKEWPDLDRALRRDIPIIPLQYLEGSWGRLPQEAAILAYLEANSATRFIIERWGISGVNALLSALKERVSVATALQSKLFVSYDQFHSRWLDTFQQKRT